MGNISNGKCDSCDQFMKEIGFTGSTIEVGDLDEKGMWKQNGIRQEMLYQCPECKDVKIQ